MQARGVTKLPQPQGSQTSKWQAKNGAGNDRGPNSPPRRLPPDSAGAPVGGAGVAWAKPSKDRGCGVPGLRL